MQISVRFVVAISRGFRTCLKLDATLARQELHRVAATKIACVNVTKNQRNRGHSSKFNFAHTLSIGRPKSHTYDKDVRLLKFSFVWEKST